MVIEPPHTGTATKLLPSLMSIKKPAEPLCVPSVVPRKPGVLPSAPALVPCNTSGCSRKNLYFTLWHEACVMLHALWGAFSLGDAGVDLPGGGKGASAPIWPALRDRCGECVATPCITHPWKLGHHVVAVHFSFATCFDDKILGFRNEDLIQHTAAFAIPTACTLGGRDVDGGSMFLGVSASNPGCCEHKSQGTPFVARN